MNAQKQVQRCAGMLWLSAAILASGCSGERCELELTCQYLQKNPNGQVIAEREETHQTFSPGGEFSEGWTVGTVSAPADGAQTSVPAPGDAGVSQPAQGGSFSVRVKRASLSGAVLLVSLNGTNANLDLVPNSPKEMFDASGNRGMRITLADVRITDTGKPHLGTVLLLINLALLPVVILVARRHRRRACQADKPSDAKDRPDGPAS